MPNSENDRDSFEDQKKQAPVPLAAYPPVRGGRSEETEMLLRKTFGVDTNHGIELLFRWYYRPLCSHAIRYVSSREVAEDIVSDIFYKFHQDRMYERVETSFRAYLFTAVRHRAFDYVKAEMKRNTSLDQASLLAGQFHQQPDQIAQFEDLYQQVENAINSLPLTRRKIYVMHRFDGKKFQEIAAELNLSLRTVEAQMYEAVHQVRRIVRAKLD